MKILIHGDNPSILYFAYKFVEKDAHVSIWSERDPLELYNDLGEPAPNWMDYLQGLRSKIFYKKVSVKRVTKSNLYFEERVVGKSRLLDDFKAFYEHDGLEQFEEFDLIIDLRKNKSKTALSQDNGYQNFHRIKENIKNEIERVSTDSLVLGDSLDTYRFLELNKSIEHRLYILLTDKALDINEYVEEEDRLFKNQIEDFELKKKAGEQRVEPIQKIHYLKNYSVLSFDKFDDSEEIFACVSKPSFRGGDGKHEVIKVKNVYCFNQTYEYKSEVLFLQKDEVGYYCPKIDLNIESLENEFNTILNDLLQYFSRKT